MVIEIPSNLFVDLWVEIDEGVFIGFFCVVGFEVWIGCGMYLENNVMVMGNVILGCYN